MRIHNWKNHLILTTWVLATLLLTGSCGCNNPPTTSPLQSDSAEEPGSPEVDPTPPGPRVEGDPGGIPNIGNSCYMNAVLQIFKTCYSNVFDEALKNNADSKLAQAGKAIMDQIEDDKTPATRETAEAFLAAIESPEGLSWKVDRDRHEDAEELLTKLSDYLALSKAEFHEILINKNTKLEKEASPGSVPQHILQLCLDKPTDESAKSMQDWADKEFAEEELSGYKWDEADTAPTPTIKKVRISGLEKLHNGILPIQAKRFAIKEGIAVVPCALSKIEDPIEEPLSIAIRKEHQYNGTEDKHYDLVAFIEHSGGSTDSGHYVAYAKRGEQWVQYNDASVSGVTPEKAKEAAKQATCISISPELRHCLEQLAINTLA